MTTRPLSQQISEVRRELALRQRVYPGLVTRGKMRQAEADECMARMQAVHDTLTLIAEHEDAVRAVLLPSTRRVRGGYIGPDGPKPRIPTTGSGVMPAAG